MRRLRGKGGAALVKVLRTLASLLGMSAAMLTWVVGFRLNQHESFVSTTLALLIGLGAVWQLNDRRWGMSWILEVVALPLGFYFNSVSPYFPLPSVLIVGSLLFVMLASLTAKAAAARKAADEAADMQREKG